MSTRNGSVRKRHTRTCASRSGRRCRCDGSWQLRARLASGERVEQGGFPSREAAEAALRDLLRDVDRGTYRRADPIGFRDFCESWLREVRPTIRPSTFVSYEGHANVHLKPYFGDVLLSKIDAGLVRRFVSAKADAGTWKPKTIHNVLLTLKLVLDAAVEAGHLAVNPAAKVRPPRNERPELELLSADELARALDAAAEPWRTAFDMLSWTAVRRGELLAARWSDVDLPAGRLYVRRSRGRYGEGAPKSRAGVRVVILTPRIVALLRRHRLAQAPSGADDDGYVFVTRNGTPIDGDNLTGAWTRALRKAGVRHVSLHALRHHAVSRMIQSGASVKTVQTVVGHASASLTLQVYSHMLPDDLAALAAHMAACDPKGDPSGATPRARRSPREHERR
jgi:integrase